jgi:Flp pilus assembly protein TadD
MAERATIASSNRLGLLATLAATFMLGACAQGGDGLQSQLMSQANEPPAQAQEQASQGPQVAQTELEKATDYWGKKFREQPRDLDAALSYAKNLKAMGEKQQALAVIQQAAVFHGDDKKLASEYGRLALDMDQISIAKQMLAVADDPTAPDWRVVSARGTVLAKEGKFPEAIVFYERAVTLSQDQTSVLNNLAMAYTMSGEPTKAEEILRKIEAKGGNAKTRQNLALVLGVQGKFDEAKSVGSADIGADGASSNTDYMKRMVKTADAPTPPAKPVKQASAKAPKPAIKPAVEDAPADSDAPPRVAMSEGPGTLRGMTR